MVGAVLLLAVWALGMVGCTGNSAAAGAGAPPPPPDVEVAVVEQKDIPIVREWIGTLDGMVNAAIKAQVTGYLLKQNYAEGSFVRKGQLLFEIDPRPSKPRSIRLSASSPKPTHWYRRPRRDWYRRSRRS